MQNEKRIDWVSCFQPNQYEKSRARVAELVDALDLGSSSGDRVGVQVSPLAPF